MNTPRVYGATVCFFLLGLSAQDARATVSSTFDTDADGWTLVGDGTGLTWQSSNGNPGGFISASDLDLGVLWYFVAPAKFHGDHSDTFGLGLCFDLKQFGSGTVDDTTFPANIDVLLVGGGLTLAYVGLPVPNTDPVAPPGSATPFSQYTVTLSGSDPGWMKLSGVTLTDATDADLQTALAGVTDLEIKGEFRHLFDQGSLDNVILGCAIPEPTTGLLVALAVVALSCGTLRRAR